MVVCGCLWLFVVVCGCLWQHNSLTGSCIFLPPLAEGDEVVMGNPMAFEVGLAPQMCLFSWAGLQHCAAHVLSTAAAAMLCVYVHVCMCVCVCVCSQHLVSVMWAHCPSAPLVCVAGL